MDTLGQIVAFFSRKEEKDYYYLKQLATDIFVFPELIKTIDRIVDKFGKIKDSASPELAQIRMNIATTESGISRSLNAILRQAKADGYVDSDVALRCVMAVWLFQFRLPINAVSAALCMMNRRRARLFY